MKHRGSEMCAARRPAGSILRSGSLRGATVAAWVAAASVGACAVHASPSGQSAQLPDSMVDTFDPHAPASGEAAPRGTRDDLARLLRDGEAAYRARRSDEALAAFQRVVELDPAHAPAWLRVGNLHHQRREWFKALAAYRRVSARTGGEGSDPGLRAKALYNVALINLELARQAIRTLERIGPAANAAGAREPLTSAVRAAARRLEAFGSRDGSASGAAASNAPPPAIRATPAGDAGGGRANGAAAHEALPRINYIRGAPRP